MKYLLWIFLIFLLSLRLITFNHPFLEGQKIRIGDTVSGEPIKYSYYQSISLAGLKIYLPIFPEISYGDFLIVEGFVNGRDLKDPVLIEHRKARGFLYKLREELLDNIKRALPEPLPLSFSSFPFFSSSSSFSFADRARTGSEYPPSRWK